jgi:hypothetical protein
MLVSANVSHVKQNLAVAVTAVLVKIGQRRCDVDVHALKNHFRSNPRFRSRSDTDTVAAPDDFSVFIIAKIAELRPG